ncbi:hypothetical protein EJ04DRAFT_575651 [Polyplosphaeria fusca]|uniref:NACHT domain-containing protein n=1 Tax=Polyplosphaeria fusca TaxID=682080 RepID=A0A9P4V4B4_9PLEO|nr:hypothetical protein EJ04DRAFT_575651 [Polyplosphaeria fusca]
MSNGSTTSHAEAVDRANAIFARLPHANILFQRCIRDEITIADVAEKLQRTGSRHKRKRSTQLLDRFRDCTAWMLNISRSIDVAVQASSGIACPVWAPVKLVLLLSHEDSAATNGILEVIQSIADNLPRLELYDRFRGDSHFQVALVNLYVDITNFAVHAFRFLERRTAARLASLIKRSFKDRFSSIISDLIRRTKIVDDTAIALHQQRTEQLLQESQVKSREAERARCVQWLHPSNIQECHERTIAPLVDTTCEWILGHPTFRAWAGKSEPVVSGRLLVVHGVAGCGKSMLASYVFNEMRKSQESLNVSSTLAPSQRGHIVLFFPFSTSDPNRQSLASLIRNLLSQLLEHDQSDRVLELLTPKSATSSASTQELLSLFRTVCANLNRPLTAIIDGVDESCEPVEGLLTELLALNRAFPSHKMIVFGQSHAFGRFLASTDTSSHIVISTDLTRKDMETVINAGVSSCVSLWNADIRHAIAQSLLGQAQSMFLYAKLMLDYFKTVGSEAEVYGCLQDLPDGLNKTYDLLLHRIMTRLGKHHLKTIHCVLTIVIASGRPLNLEELRLAYALAFAPPGINPEQLQYYFLRLPPEDLVELSGGLLTYTRNLFHLVHSSVRDFLTRPRNTLLETHQNTFHVDIIEAHDLISSICFRVFQHAEAASQTENNETSGWRPLLGYARLYCAYHLNNCSKSPTEIKACVNALFQSNNLSSTLTYTDIKWEELSPHVVLEHLILFDEYLKAETASALSTTVEDVLHVWEQQAQGETADSRITQRAPIPSPEPSLPDATTRLGTHESDIVVYTPSEMRMSSHTKPANRLQANTRSVRAALPPEFHRQWSHANQLTHGVKFDLALSFIRRLGVGRLARDPLKIAWDRIKGSIASAPPLIQTAITGYLCAMSRHEEALEIGNHCYKTLKSEQSILRTSHELLMGIVAWHCDEDAQAITFFENGLQGVQRYPLIRGFYSDTLMQQCLAESYFQEARTDRALDIFRTLLHTKSYQKLNNHFSERFHLFLGRSEFMNGTMTLGVHHLLQFRERCYERYPALEKMKPESWPLCDIALALWLIAIHFFELGKDEEALAVFCEWEVVCSKPLTEDEVETLLGYQAIIYNSTNPHASNHWLDHTLHRCSYCGRVDPYQCYKQLENEHMAASNSLTNSKQLRRAVSAYMNHWSAFQTARPHLLRNLHEHGNGPAYLADLHWNEFDLHDMTGNHQEARRPLWIQLKHTDKCGSASTHEDFALHLFNMSRLEELCGNYKLAAECARAAVHFEPNPYFEVDNTARNSRLVEATRLMLQSSHPSSSYELEKLQLLAEYQDTHLMFSSVKQAYRNVSALLSPEAWESVVDMHIFGQDETDLVDKSEGFIGKTAQIGYGSFETHRRYYTTESTPYRHRQDVDDEYRCAPRYQSADDVFLPLTLTSKHFAPWHADGIGYLFGPHLPCSKCLQDAPPYMRLEPRHFLEKMEGAESSDNDGDEDGDVEEESRPRIDTDGDELHSWGARWVDRD